MLYVTKYSHYFLKFLILMIIIDIKLLSVVNSAPHKGAQLRLCSKSLSDALYLVCSNRGYNEPFSNNGDDDTKPSVPSGPGIVEECCHRWCSYAQLEQYCKPSTEATK
ncbi:hypothetical protein PV327_010607 [Microctonus hyperodae]|uniref:Insulin-like domain-containing protein n=1 Tax=Microctonus hyperodae TaxID=165561 RepID=A0AA39FSA4_MICHY|nr:hypothetical protein PV327_010607 [Microctonus hyperodae]